MDAQTGLGDEPSALLRQEIQQTQRDLSAKIGALEGEVRAVTSHATEAVRERVDAVRQVVDIRGHVGRYPFMSALVACGVGVFVGYRRRRTARAYPEGAPEGLVGGVLARQGANFRAILAARALSFAGELLRERIFGPRGGRGSE